MTALAPRAARANEYCILIDWGDVKIVEIVIEVFEKMRESLD